MKQMHVITGSIIGMALAFVLSVLFHQEAASVLTHFLGPAVLRLGQGKFNHAQAFIEHRLFEALWLATVAVLLWAAFALLNEMLRRRRVRYPWIWGALSGFIALNIWMG